MSRAERPPVPHPVAAALSAAGRFLLDPPPPAAGDAAAGDAGAGEAPARPAAAERATVAQARVPARQGAARVPAAASPRAGARRIDPSDWFRTTFVGDPPERPREPARGSASPPPPLAPAEDSRPPAPHRGPAAPPARHPTLAVVPLSRRAGASTVARALGVVLALRSAGTAIVTTRAGDRSLGLTGGRAPLWRGAAALTGRPARPAGRLCLLECAEGEPAPAAAARLAPLVIDAEYGCDPASLSDRGALVVLVAAPGTPAPLAAAARLALDRAGAASVLCVNRASAAPAWAPAALALPDSRVGARLALAGRRPGGSLGLAVSELADLCGALG